MRSDQSSLGVRVGVYMYNFTIIHEKKNAPVLTVQHGFGGMRDGEQNRGGMLDMRNIEGGIGIRSFQLVERGIVLKLMAGCGI